METFVPNRLNIPQRKVKGLHRMYNTGIPAIFYFTTSVVREGQPMKFSTTVVEQIDPCVMGNSDGAKCAGLALQETYDDSAYGQLMNFHFANDTRQRLDGQPIGLMTGAGFALTNNYAGTPVYGDKMAVGPSGYLVKQGTLGTAGGDNLPVVCEGNSGNFDYYDNGQTVLIRIRYNFTNAFAA
jgi:hypothetical protein